MKLNSNVILTIIGTLLIGGGAYWYFFTGTGTQAPLTSDTTTSQAQAQFQTLIAELPVSFDTSIFSEPNFMALVDLTTPIAPETAGRLDPFAQISAGR